MIKQYVLITSSFFIAEHAAKFPWKNIQRGQEVVLGESTIVILVLKIGDL